VEADAVFRRRLRQLIERKYRSVDRFWLESEFQRVVGKPRKSRATKSRRFRAARI